MLTDAEHAEVLLALGYVEDGIGALLHEDECEECDRKTNLPAIDSPLVRAQMMDWLLEREMVIGREPDSPETPAHYYVKPSQLLDCPEDWIHGWSAFTISATMAWAVLEVSRADV